MTFSKQRLQICKSCEFFIPLTTTCKQCGCFMALKTKFPKATCPVGKWDELIEEVASN